MSKLVHLLNDYESKVPCIPWIKFKCCLYKTINQQNATPSVPMNARVCNPSVYKTLVLFAIGFPLTFFENLNQQTSAMGKIDYLLKRGSI